MTSLTTEKVRELCEQYSVPEEFKYSSEVKLWFQVLFHHFVLKRIESDQRYISEVRLILERLSTTPNYNPFFTSEWTKILNSQDFSCLVEKNEEMDRLRTNSPFLFTDVLSYEDKLSLYKHLQEKEVNS